MSLSRIGSLDKWEQNIILIRLIWEACVQEIISTGIDNQLLDITQKTDDKTNWLA